MPMLESHKYALSAWIDSVERWLAERGITRAELLELWEGVSPTTPPDAGST